MKERPIIFNGEMVRAVLDRRKTQTRRVMKADKRFHPRGYYPGHKWHFARHPEGGWYGHDGDPGRARPILGKGGGFICPYGAPGDRLWVRETWQPLFYPNTMRRQSENYVAYRADGATREVASLHKTWKMNRAGTWRPSIHMPRWASRITLEVTDVRVERVQEISEDDAIAEGVGHGFQINAGWPDYQHIKNGVCELTQDTAKMSFATLWDSINAKRGYGWDVNPYVWVVTFKVLDGEEVRA